MEMAGEVLEEAYALNPQMPHAAALMIKVSMCHCDDARREMRRWFDRATATCIDYVPAYNYISFGFWPRWHGSTEDLVAFGELCLGTERYDTVAPLYSLIALKSVLRSRDREDYGLLVKEERSYQRVASVLERYLQEPAMQDLKEYFHSHYAIWAHCGKRYEDAHRNLSAIDYELTPFAMRDWPNVNVQDLLLESATLGGRWGDEALKAERAYESRDFGAARTRFGELVEECESDPRAKTYVKNRLATIEMEDRLGNGGWVSFLPPKDFTGWRIDQGIWEVLPDGDLECVGDRGETALFCRSRVSSDFEIQGTIELPWAHEDSACGGASLFLGDLLWGKENWMSVTLTCYPEGKETCCYQHCFYRTPSETKAVLEKRNTIRLVCFNGSVALWINGAQVLEDVPPDEDVKIDRDDCRLGFGHKWNKKGNVVRYRGFRVRRLQKAPPSR